MLTLSPYTESIIAARALENGKTPDEIVLEAFAPSLALLPMAETPRRRRASLAGILAVADRSAARPRLDHRPADAIIGYDAHGLPA